MPVTFEEKANREVAGILRDKAAVRMDAYAEMLPEIRARAFAVSGVEDMKTLHRIEEAIARVPEGGDWKEARRQIAAELGDPEKAAHRAETVLRTNCFEAYAAARYRAAQADKDVMPYLVYHCVGDDRVRPEHRALDGTVLPVDDPFWETHYPPWDWGCRCTVSGMTQLEHDEEMAAAKDGGDTAFKFPTQAQLSKIPGAAPSGFSFNPKSLAMDLDDLNGRKYAGPSKMRDFSRKMLEHETEDAQGRRETVWDWLVRKQMEKDAERLREGIMSTGATETVIVRDYETGGGLLVENGKPKTVGGDRARRLFDAARRSNRRLVGIHRHTGGESAVPSPEDVLMALNPASKRQHVVSSYDSATISVSEAGRFSTPHAIEREVEEQRKKLESGEIELKEWAAWLKGQPWAKYKQDGWMEGLRP